MEGNDRSYDSLQIFGYYIENIWEGKRIENFRGSTITTFIQTVSFFPFTCPKSLMLPIECLINAPCTFSHLLVPKA